MKNASGEIPDANGLFHGNGAAPMQTPAGALGMARECKSERLWHCGVNLPLAQRTRYLPLS